MKSKVCCTTWLLVVAAAPLTAQTPPLEPLQPGLQGGVFGAGMPPALAGPLPPGTTVQLPTFQFFTVGTTVSVPDSGRAFVAGPRVLSTGSTAFGPSDQGAGRTIGQAVVGGNLHLSAEIHLQPDEEPLPTVGTAHGAEAHLIGRQLQAARASSAGQADVSVDQARAQYYANLALEAEQAERYFDQGRQAEAADKPGVARIFYQMALRRAVGPLREQILKRLAELESRAGGAPGPRGP